MDRNGMPPLPPGAKPLGVNPFILMVMQPDGSLAPAQLVGPEGDVAILCHLAAQVHGRSHPSDPTQIAAAVTVAMNLVAEVMARRETGDLNAALEDARVRYGRPANVDETKAGRSVDLPAGPRLEP